MPWIENTSTVDAWNSRHIALKTAIAHAKPDVLFAGDSITERWINVGKQFWDSTFAPLNAFNAGIGRETTQGLLWRLGQYEFSDASPSTVVLLIGTNNVSSSDEGSVVKGVKAVADGFKQQFKSARIIVLSILPRESATSVNRTKVNRINQELKHDASSSRYYFCDVGQFLLGENDALITPAYLADGVHLTADGYGRIAVEVASAISGTSRNCFPQHL